MNIDIKSFKNISAEDFNFQPIKFKKEDVKEWLGTARIFVDDINKLTTDLINI